MKKIRESDMTDKRNNIVISPGLKTTPPVYTQH